MEDMNKEAIEENKNEEAATMGEYAILLGLITLSIAAVITVLGERICNAISKAATAIAA